MENENLIKRGKELIEEVASILERLSDAQVVDMLGTGSLTQLLRAIFDPDTDKSKYANLQDFLLANRGRSTLVALLRYAITHNYSFKGVIEDGKSCFISPSYVQWFDDGVMFLQSYKRFEGLIGLYRKDKTLSYAVAARDTQKGEQMGPEHFEFIDSVEYGKRLKQFPKSQIANLDQPIHELKALLESKDNDESKYQELLINHPWVLGAKYRKIQRHTKLDDKNIPDFTGIRVRDDCRDIFEIKSPFTRFFRNNGEFSANFYEAWSQAERYLDFARQETDYLRRKRFRFENPKCYLILGFNLSINEIRQIRTKERMNPAIELLTYDDLLIQMKWTASFIRNLKDEKSNFRTESKEQV